MADINGTNGNDSWTNDDTNDRYFGHDGDDTMRGGNGTQVLYPGTNPTANGDWIYGGNGNDLYYGNGGNDNLIEYENTTGRDTMFGGNGNDTLNGGADNDRLFGDAGNDAVVGGSGNDHIEGDNASMTTSGGNDTLSGGSGDDSIYGQLGSDTIDGGTGNDLLYGDRADGQGVGGNDYIAGGDGNDTVWAGGGDDTVLGGLGDDVIQGEAGADHLEGNDGFDSLWGGDDNDTLIGGAGNDALLGDAGDDSLSGGDDNDSLWGGDGNDALAGGTGDDVLQGELGADTLRGDTGNDTLWGGDDNDLLDGGDDNDWLEGEAGDDTLTGGLGDDIFVWDEASNDVITDFGTDSGGPYTDADQSNNDFVDLSGIFNDATLQAYNDANGTSFVHPIAAMNDDLADGVISFNGTDMSGPTLTMTGITGGLTWDQTNVMCFGPDTRIVTLQGELRAADLAVGDKVLTLDSGYQPIRWIGRRTLSARDLALSPKLRPIRIRAGALGKGMPESDLIVSPQHRVLVRGPVPERMFGAREILAAAKQLLELDGIEVAQDLTQIDYIHFLFDKHEIVWSNGAPTESLFTGPEALKAIHPDQIAEIFAIFPELRTADVERDERFEPARLLAPGRRARSMAGRLSRNGQLPLQQCAGAQVDEAAKISA